MTHANVLAALDELRREYEEVGTQVERMQRDLAAQEARHERLGEAIESLERLNEPEAAPGTAPEPETAPEPGAGLDDDIPDGPLVSADSPIAKYIKRGGKGRRLSSTSMVVDLLGELDRVVSREELRETFFEKFSHEEVSRFWERPDNAFSTALARALKDELILRGNRKNGTEVYASHTVGERLRQKKDEKAASSEIEVEEGR
jgi:hypothetical protein